MTEPNALIRLGKLAQRALHEAMMWLAALQLPLAIAVMIFVVKILPVLTGAP